MDKDKTSLQKNQTENKLKIDPDHLDDLRKSGLTDETIAKAKIYSLDDITTLPGFTFNLEPEYEKGIGPDGGSWLDNRLADEGITFNDLPLSGYVIPYFGSNTEYYLVKPDAHTEERQWIPKYLAPSPSSEFPPEIYFPKDDRILKALKDPAIPLALTEGPKKAWKGTQEGFFTLGLSGVWNFLCNGKLIDDFKKVIWIDRLVYIVFDTPDIYINKHVIKAENSLFHHLRHLGANPRIVHLPHDKENKNKKIALDDFMVQNFHDPMGELRKYLNTTEPARIKNILKMKEKKKKEKTDIRSIIEIVSRLTDSEYESLRTDIAKICDFRVNVLDKERKKLIPSFDETDEEAQLPPARSVKDGLDTVINTILKHVELPDPSIATLLAFWILGCSLYSVFDVYGYLSLTSATKRCGKTLLLKLLSLFVLGRFKVLTDPSASSIFRLNRPLFMNESEQFGNKADPNKKDLIGILNAGFEKGGTVDRSVPDGDDWIVKEFDVYSPKAFAAICKLSDTLRDRCFSIILKRSAERKPRLRMAEAGVLGLQVVSDFRSFADKYGKVVKEIYAKRPDETDKLKKFDDRFQDIGEPLFILSETVDSLFQTSFSDVLLKAFNEVLDKRELSRDEQQFTVFINYVEDWFNHRKKQKKVGPITIATDPLLSLLKNIDDLRWPAENKKRFSIFAAHFDLKPGRDPKTRTSTYQFTEKWLQEWRKRYPRILDEERK